MQFFNDTLLITLGCSWTFGVGVNYEKNMNFKEYERNAWNKEICDEFSFRGLLSKKYKLNNLNLSCGGSSNQKQFRLATEFFSTNIDTIDINKFFTVNGYYPFKHIKNNYEKIIVLWGITSTARYEIFNSEKNILQNDFYRSNNKISKFLAENTYSHAHQLETLSINIQFWNDYFMLNNISIIWFDTFNHHEYEVKLYNFFKFEKKPRDLLSLITNLEANNYHLSEWIYEDKRLIIGKQENLLNSFSYHPTKLGHQKICDLLSPEIKKLI